jgi:pSer/pThr/pTyr-binding forkhead associated (FHA) protein
MTPFALTAIQIGVVALVYLFIWRAVRTLSMDLRGKREPPPPPVPKRAKAQRKKKKGDRSPSSVAIVDDRGKRLGTYRLTGTISVGRADKATIRLADTYASQQHARLVEHSGGWMIEDLGSTNGTFVNERRVESLTPVKAGDKVRIGTTTLELRP